MREYRQLTDEDRIEIYAMKQAGKEQNMIAAKQAVHPSTIPPMMHKIIQRVKYLSKIPMLLVSIFLVSSVVIYKPFFVCVKNHPANFRKSLNITSCPFYKNRKLYDILINNSDFTHFSVTSQ